MKTLQKTCAATILMLVLAVSIAAGEIDCPGVVSPPPPAPTSTTTTSITTTIILTIVGLIP
ncbi:MAG TPA: hypothetical protein VFR78_03130 [Pyrinomonadaceae bacterium]|nr:hypothetical protein [Pyrinomonadaceae bacterium]